jgi:ABC-type transport system substrate-binding protein
MTARAVAVAASLALLGCDAVDHGPRFRAAGNPTPRDGGTLRFSIQGTVATLDPTTAYDELSFLAIRPMFETLVDLAPGGFEVEPRLAERWTRSADGLVYAFELRAGQTFADGEPITAAHVKYGLERALTTADSPFGPFLADVVGAEDVLAHKATTCAGLAADGLRLTITLGRRNPALLQILAMPFATPQRAAHVARAGDQLRRTPDATGPFALARWDQGQLELRRNPAYRGARRAHVDALVVLENVPRDTQFLMFERGELDTAEKLAAPDYLYVASAPAWQPYLHRTSGLNAFGARMNTRVWPFSDRRVRQALNYAANKAHSERLLGATSVASHGILPPGMPGRDPALAPYPHDPAKARALLAEAGLANGYLAEYLVPSDEETEKIAASLQADLAEVGFQIRIVPMTWPAYQELIGRPTGSAFSFGTWLGDYADPSAFFEPVFHSRAIQDAGSSNSTFYASPALDDVLDRAHAALDPAERARLYREAERILYDDAPWIWDHHRQTAEVVQPYVRGYEPHPVWGRDYTEAWLDLGADGARERR